MRGPGAIPAFYIIPRDAWAASRFRPVDKLLTRRKSGINRGG